MNTSTRTRGVTVTILPREALKAIVEEARPGFQAYGPQALLKTTTGWAIVNVEGVGLEVEEFVEDGKIDGTAGIFVTSGNYIVEDIEIPFAPVLALAPEGEEVDLADFVRTFGDRLERNFEIWHGRAAK